MLRHTNIPPPRGKRQLYYCCTSEEEDATTTTWRCVFDIYDEVIEVVSFLKETQRVGTLAAAAAATVVLTS